MGADGVVKQPENRVSNLLLQFPRVRDSNGFAVPQLIYCARRILQLREFGGRHQHALILWLAWLIT